MRWDRQVLSLFCRRGPFARRAWSTSVVDVGTGQLLDVVPGRTAQGPANNLIKRVKRAAFGFTNFANYRIRAPALRRQAQLGTARHPHSP